METPPLCFCNRVLLHDESEELKPTDLFGMQQGPGATDHRVQASRTPDMLPVKLLSIASNGQRCRGVLKNTENK